VTGSDDTRRARHRQPADLDATDPALPIPVDVPERAADPARTSDQERPAAARARAGRSGVERAGAAGADGPGRAGEAPPPVRSGRRRRADRSGPDHGRADGGPVAADAHAGHGHGHGPPPAADRRIRIAIAALLVPVVLATVAGLLLLFPYTPVDPAEASPRVAGTVTATAESDCSPGEGDRGCAALTVRLTDGDLAGTSIVTLVSVVRGVAPFTTGDDVVLVVTGDPADPESYQVEDFQRGTPLLVLALLFAAAVVALARWRGVAALV
jgi:hypothetical protein